ncbi:PilW family protein [Paraglaciecola arctica]|uniref:Type IV pilus assembly protein PilW n=1 Tax=Paraglaciecola arctica BSs20135 TaxID=493475 RepID=K6Z4W8_9ALTE|nr:PilW family protein [Paraglaciecola arctica]GAC18460.1 type IV pilus assembly protein PilW [Paraglaciecola arctica BSs20135]|tara:strand:+ start:1321 stop:2178 length:858 start_codon:yes stop_codon:yes gene_type:complete
MNVNNKQSGFSLIELMISLTLGLIVSAAVVQVMISNNSTERLNRSIASAQENGRFIIARLRNDLIMTGRYDMLRPELNKDVDIVVEAAFVQNNPIPVVGDFSNGLAKGAIEGVGTASDTLMVVLQGTNDCRGATHGYVNEEFMVVNEYFLDGTSLKCRGFDGRVLRGQKAEVDGDTAYTLLDDVVSFQVQYGITDNIASQDNSARPVKFIDADTLDAEKAAGALVVAIRIALLLKADSDVLISPVPQFKLLNEDPIQPSEKRLYKQFETTITLRNSKNFARSRNI